MSVATLRDKVTHTNTHETLGKGDAKKKKHDEPAHRYLLRTRSAIRARPDSRAAVKRGREEQ
jgi:hypothetical protein